MVPAIGPMPLAAEPEGYSIFLTPRQLKDFSDFIVEAYSGEDVFAKVRRCSGATRVHILGPIPAT